MRRNTVGIAFATSFETDFYVFYDELSGVLHAQHIVGAFTALQSKLFDRVPMLPTNISNAELLVAWVDEFDSGAIGFRISRKYIGAAVQYSKSLNAFFDVVVRNSPFKYSHFTQVNDGLDVSSTSLELSRIIRENS